MKQTMLCLACSLALLIFATPTSATSITYTATNLADKTLGEDLWQYSYQVSNHAFLADTGFTIYFELGLFDLLDPSPTLPNSDWDIVTWNPDSGIPADGAYDAYALVDGASLLDSFTINFVWLGGSAGPGPQIFDVYDGLTYDVLESGATALANQSTSVPTPPTLWLIGLGVALLTYERISPANRKNKRLQRPWSL